MQPAKACSCGEPFDPDLDYEECEVCREEGDDGTETERRLDNKHRAEDMNRA